MADNHEMPVMTHSTEVAAKLQRLVSSGVYRQMRKQMLDMILPLDQDPVTIYDIGCGEGSFCRDIRNNVALQPGSRLVGMDTSPFVLDIAKEQEPLTTEQPIDYMLVDATDLPCDDDSADVVVFANTLKYLKTEHKKAQAMKEIGRVLRPGGRLLIVDGNDAEITYSSIDQVLTDKVVKIYAELQGDPYAGSQIESLFRHVGIEDVQQRTVQLVEERFTPEFAGFAMAQNIYSVVAEYVTENPKEKNLKPEVVAKFLEDLAVAALNGQYRWRYDKYMVAGNSAI